MTAVIVAFFLGSTLGVLAMAFFAATHSGREDLREWRYECTCGWRCHYLASVMLAPSYLRCGDCQGVAVRRREPEGEAA